MWHSLQGYTLPLLAYKTDYLKMIVVVLTSTFTNTHSFTYAHITSHPNTQVIYSSSRTIMSRDHPCACSWVLLYWPAGRVRDLSVLSHALKFHSLTLAILPNWALGLWEVWKPLVAKLRERRNSGGGSYSSGRPVTPQLSNYTAWNVSIDSQNKIIK